MKQAEKAKNIFSFNVTGDMFFPKYVNGISLLIEPVDKPIHKQQVIYKKDGEYLLRRLMIQGSSVALWPINAKDKTIIMLDLDAIKASDCELYRILKIGIEPD